MWGERLTFTPFSCPCLRFPSSFLSLVLFLLCLLASLYFFLFFSPCVLHDSLPLCVSDTRLFPLRLILLTLSLLLSFHLRTSTSISAIGRLRWHLMISPAPVRLQVSEGTPTPSKTSCDQVTFFPNVILFPHCTPS